MNISDLPSRIHAKIELELCVNPELPGLCWGWTGARNSKGYGSASHQGRIWSTHRLVYALLRGPIAPGLQIDHLCRNKRCCNPSHLEAVTAKVNMQRAYAATTACVHGHAYTPENTIIKKNGHRNCRTCANEWQRNYRAQLKAAS